MGSGAWPFLVGGVICLVYFDNERDLSLLNSSTEPSVYVGESLGFLFLFIFLFPFFPFFLSFFFREGRIKKRREKERKKISWGESIEAFMEKKDFLEGPARVEQRGSLRR